LTLATSGSSVGRVHNLPRRADQFRRPPPELDELRRLGFAGAVGHALGEAVAQDRPAPAAAGTLTPRELEVGRLVAEGLSDREIAARLVIAQRTAETHVQHILRKLGARSRAQIAAWVAREG
jgi:non-specific serine/threonine protein kinase